MEPGKLFKPIQYINTQALDPSLTYKEFMPSDFLLDFISCYWIVETSSNDAKNIDHRILPDGCIDIIFDYTSNSSFLCGLSDNTEYLTLNGKIRFFGIRFLPHTISYILKSDTPNNQNCRFDLGLISNFLKDLSIHVLEIENLITRIHIIENYLRLFFKEYQINKRFNSLLNHVINTRGTISVKELSSYHSISEKQIGRYFINNIGISTKPFLRIIRFQNAYQNLASYKHTNISLALDTGYYDQSHLIKDLKGFLGKNKNFY